jgi:hypothetical protein
MSTFITLPVPLAGSSMVPGQLISDPFNGAAIVSCLPSPSKHQPDTRSTIHSGIVHDTQIKYNSKQSERKDSVVGTAEETVEVTLTRPRTFFNSSQQDKDTVAFLQQHTTLYFVTGIQKRALLDERVVAEASEENLRLPTHVRRPDSASVPSPNHTNSLDTKSGAEGSIVAVELRKIRCRVGDKAAPHEAGDLDYDWNYFALGNELQLSIGLGDVLKATVSGGDEGNAECGEDKGMALDKGLSDDNWDYALSEDDDDSGLGGF